MIKPREQQYTQSCLPVSLAMLCDVEMTKKQEGDVLLKGLEKKYSDYPTGMLSEFTKKYKKDLKVRVEYKVFSKYLADKFKVNKYLKVLNEKISLANLKKYLAKDSVLTYLDAKYLEYGYYADHMPHYIMIEEIKDGKVTIVDPWEGVRRDIDQSSLLQAIKSLKTQFKYSPIIISL